MVSKKRTFTDLVVCNGHHWNPKYPNYPGKFSGEFIHSHQFKKASPFQIKKYWLLVVEILLVMLL